MRARRGVGARRRPVLGPRQAHAGARHRARRRTATTCSTGPIAARPARGRLAPSAARRRRAHRHHQGGRSAVALLRRGSRHVSRPWPPRCARRCARGLARVPAPPARAAAARRRSAAGRRPPPPLAGGAVGGVRRRAAAGVVPAAWLGRGLLARRRRRRRSFRRRCRCPCVGRRRRGVAGSGGGHGAGRRGVGAWCVPVGSPFAARSWSTRAWSIASARRHEVVPDLAGKVPPATGPPP